jgi:hypothetical protein
MVLVAGVYTKYVPQRMRCRYTLNFGQSYHAKLGHVLSENTLIHPHPHPSHSTRAMIGVYLTPHKRKKGAHGKNILIPVVQDNTGYRHTHLLFQQQTTVPIRTARDTTYTQQ